MNKVARILSCAFTLAILAMPSSFAQIKLLAVGTLDQTQAGPYTDLSGLTYTLENGVAANYLGGMGSAITYAGNNTFLALPDRGPNAVSFDSNVDDTVSYVNRFHTVQMTLKRNTTGSGYPYLLKPSMSATTLLWTADALVYGAGDSTVGSGVPQINTSQKHYFTGRSANFDPAQNSGNPLDARFDTEGIRLSSDGRRVYISDEYGPYVYEFDRFSGKRLRAFGFPPCDGVSPSCFFVSNLSSMGSVEISGNTVGRTANKGMEGLAITPDGTTLVGIMQNALIQDSAEGGSAKNLLRIVTFDLASGAATHQYAYLLTTGSGVSEILAINDHEFLVDERDGHGRADASKAKVKQLFKIDLTNAVDVSNMDGLTAAANAVSKTLFLDLVQLLTKNGIGASEIPAKVEGIAFGADVTQGKTTLHTLWIANDNDFLATVQDANGNNVANPNQYFVVGFTDSELGGSKFVPQVIKPAL